METNSVAQFWNRKILSKIIIVVLLIFCSNITFGQFIFPTTKKIDIAKINVNDPENSEVTLSIVSGNTGKYFSITPCSGIIRVDTLAYSAFVYRKTWIIKFKATDEDGYFSYMEYTFVLKKDGAGNKFPPVYTYKKL